jgi:hypothetical protein
MKAKGFVAAALFLLALPAMAAAQSGKIAPEKSGHASPNPAASQAASSFSAAEPAAEPAKPLCGGLPCDEQQPRVVVTVPQTPPAPWTRHEQISWAALLLLAVIGYIGVLMALSLLRKIERSTRAAEAAASAAAQSAQSALLQAQALIESTRPWLVAHTEPALNVENGFRVLITNHGKSPARLESIAERIVIVKDEQSLPEQPFYPSENSGQDVRLIVLLPGESRQLQAFRRDEAQGVCENEEQFRRVENWEEKIFLYGKALYRDLSALEDREPYQTNWCCWYIHGQQKSGMTIAGPQAYNRHT